MINKLAIAAIAAIALSTGSAMAQTKLSQNECTHVWQQAGGTAAGLSEAQAKAYVTDFKAANPDGDATIDQKEFMAACHKGLVKSSASTGASSGTSGSSSSGSSSSGSSSKMPESR